MNNVSVVVQNGQKHLNLITLHRTLESISTMMIPFKLHHLLTQWKGQSVTQRQDKSKESDDLKVVGAKIKRLHARIDGFLDFSTEIIIIIIIMTLNS